MGTIQKHIGPDHKISIHENHSGHWELALIDAARADEVTATSAFDGLVNDAVAEATSEVTDYFRAERTAVHVFDDVEHHAILSGNCVLIRCSLHQFNYYR